MNKIARLLFLILLHLATYSAFGQGDTISISKIDSCKISKSGQFYFASNFQQLVNFHNDNNFNLDITTRASLARNKSTGATVQNRKQTLNCLLPNISTA
ncbi:MAG: hypothetical protein IPF75_04085 [Bacteroidetes bacterium]|nr:hypothetical protein [Bacteroidota bacterium]